MPPFFEKMAILYFFIILFPFFSFIFMVWILLSHTRTIELLCNSGLQKKKPVPL